jgi:hypothetical protein
MFPIASCMCAAHAVLQQLLDALYSKSLEIAKQTERGILEVEVGRMKPIVRSHGCSALIGVVTKGFIARVLNSIGLQHHWN